MENVLPFLLILVLGKVSTFSRRISSLIGSKFIINQKSVWLICLVLGYNAVKSILGAFEVNGDISTKFIPLFLLTTGSFLIFQIYFSRRSHKNGDLTFDENKGISTLVVICIAFFVTSSMNERNANDIMLYMTGSIVASSVVALFAFVADTWYTVGTGEFFMVALDTVGILFYFVSPIVILLVRFHEKYHETITDFTHHVMKRCNETFQAFDFLEGNKNEFDVQHDLVLLMLYATTLGVVLVHNLCPITGHLYGRIFTHGPPNTKKVAICIDFTDFKAVLIRVLNNPQKEITLCVSLTLQNLREDVELIERLHKAGHDFGIALEDSSDRDSLFKSYSLFQKIIGEKPKWCFSKSTHSYQKAQKLGMQCILWSTSLNISTSNTSIITERVLHDLEAHNGGNIIYCRVTERNQADLHHMLLTLTKCIKDLGYDGSNLDNTIGQKNQMNL